MLVLAPSVDRFGQQQINASFTQGDVVAWTFRLAIGNIPINLNGAVIRMTIGMRTPVVLTTDNGGISILDAVGGQFIVKISSAITGAFIPGTYNYDLWLEQNIAPPVETQYITGNVTVNQSTSASP